ncbi:MAG TPA: PRC-barrel domain-containing protein [Stellaceae bacterium]|nr:PRC-barrel domain-containing protein [Stellaceae bacterium]
MSKSNMAVAMAVLMAAVAPVAYAQTMASPAPARSTPNHTRSAPSAFITGSGELRASEIIGSTVYDVQNQNVGSVKDIVLDRDGRVSAVVIDVGAFLGVGGKNVAVALNDLKTTNDRLTLNRSKSQLQQAQPYHLTEDNNR